MILSDAEMDRNEFYSDFLGPWGLRYFVAAQILCTESHQAVFSVQRSPKQGHVDREEMTLMERLVPHLRQASELKFRLAAVQFGEQLGLGNLELLEDGCVVIDRSGRVMHLNSRAHDIVARPDGISTSNNQLTLADKDAARHYRKVIGELVLDDADVAGRDFPAPRPSGGRPFVISVRPLPREGEFSRYTPSAAAIVFIRDPARFTRLNTELFRQTYGLSQAEAGLAAALDRGATAREIAQDREVSITTVRSQLYALMSKTGVRRQTDLVRLMSQYRRPFS